MPPFDHGPAAWDRPISPSKPAVPAGTETHLIRAYSRSKDARPRQSLIDRGADRLSAIKKFLPSDEKAARPFSAQMDRGAGIPGGRIVESGRIVAAREGQL
jgi:hypothetical protein